MRSMRGLVRPAAVACMGRTVRSVPIVTSAPRWGGVQWSRREFSSNVIPMIDKENLQKRLEDPTPYLFIDVREPNELVHGVIPHSINIPLKELTTAFGLRPGEFRRKYGVDKPTPDTEIIFACRAGPRAMQGAQNINAMGYDKTICYYGSFIDWFGRSYPM